MREYTTIRYTIHEWYIATEKLTMVNGAEYYLDFWYVGEPAINGQQAAVEALHRLQAAFPGSYFEILEEDVVVNR